MKAKARETQEYLLQLKKLDKLIENKMRECEQWKAIAMRTSSFSEGDRVQSSGSQQKMADAIDKYLDIEAEINRCIDELYDKRMEIISMIEQLNATEYDVLHKMYVQNLDYYAVAEACGQSYSWATTVHGRALQHLQKILKEKGKI